MGEIVRVNREVSTDVGLLTPGRDWTVPLYEHDRLKRIGALEDQTVEEHAGKRAERAALIPDEDMDAIAQAGSRTHRMAKGASSTR